jgi:O-antigen/teichoic acid export membrane protein
MRRSHVVWQTSIFTGSNVTVSVLAIASTALLTRHLTTSAYGSFAFAVSLMAFAAMFFEFGIFSAAARIAATSFDSDQRSVVGAALLAYVPLGILFSFLMFGLSFVVDDVFDVGAGPALRAASFVSFAVPFVFAGQQLAQGIDRLHISSLTGVVIQIVIVGSYFAFARVDRLNASTALVGRAAAILIGSLLVAAWLRPLARNVRAWLRTILAQARDYGFNVYVGRLLSIGTYNMDVLMLGYWATAGDVGFYTLAGSIAAVAGLPMLGLSTTLFGRMAREQHIEQHWILVTALMGAALAVLAWLLAAPFIRLVFSPAYLDAAPLVLPLALAQGVRGVTGVYNTFLAAHGRGRELRNAGFVLTGSNLLFNFALIPPFGAMGAAWASLLALILNLVAHVGFYQRSLALAS